MSGVMPQVPDPKKVPENSCSHPHSAGTHTRLASRTPRPAAVLDAEESSLHSPDLVAHDNTAAAVRPNGSQCHDHPVPGEDENREEKIPEAFNSGQGHPGLVEEPPSGPGAAGEIPGPAKCHNEDSEAVAPLPVPSSSGPGKETRLPVSSDGSRPPG